MLKDSDGWKFPHTIILIIIIILQGFISIIAQMNCINSDYIL
jgi:hypothetical protein